MNHDGLKIQPRCSFDHEGTMEPPENMYPVEAHVKPEWVEQFRHSACSAFFSYLPLSFWNTVVDETNKYSLYFGKNGKAILQSPLTLDRLMVFLGILFYIVLEKKGIFI